LLQENIPVVVAAAALHHVRHTSDLCCWYTTFHLVVTIVRVTGARAIADITDHRWRKHRRVLLVFKILQRTISTLRM